MSVLYGSVDGTGTPDGNLYAKTYYNSLCHRVWMTWETGLRWYLRGPTVDGIDTQERGRKLAEWTEQNCAGKKGIIFAGHSRGGAAAIHAAYLLQEKGIEIDYLFLYDAVNMQTMLRTHYIPENVKNVFHALRDPGARSRPFWGNTGRGCRDSSVTRYTEQVFYCTHSGVGGLPWQLYYKEIEGIDKPDNEFIWEDAEYRSTLVPMKQDMIGSKQAADWALGALRQAKSTLSQKTAGAQQQQQKPNGAGPGAAKPGAGNGAGGGTTSSYTVVSGDSLSAITGRLWSDVLLWPILYDTNKSTIGSNPNLIKVGQKLSIPNIKAYSSSQLEQARSRGRNWR